MKKIVLMISIILILGTISPVMASIQPDLYEEDGTPIYYIDVSQEEWENTFMNHPYFQSYNPEENVIFRMRGNIQTRAICYKCGKNSMSLHQDWSQVENMSRQCPGQPWGSDLRVGYTWVYGDYCNSCGLLGGLTWNQDRYSWSWIMSCLEDGNDYKILLGKSIDDGYNLHQCYSIEKNDNGIVHGLNCSCH